MKVTQKRFDKKKSPATLFNC